MNLFHQRLQQLPLGNLLMFNLQVRNRRQLILQFITANKGRLSDTYVCLICNKQVVKIKILTAVVSLDCFWNFEFFKATFCRLQTILT